MLRGVMWQTLPCMMTPSTVETVLKANCASRALGANGAFDAAQTLIALASWWKALIFSGLLLRARNIRQTSAEL